MVQNQRVLLNKMGEICHAFSKDVTIMYCFVLVFSPPSNIPGCRWQMKVQ